VSSKPRLVNRRGRRERDADHVRGDALDLADLELAAARLMSYAARRARIDIGGGDRGGC